MRYRCRRCGRSQPGDFSLWRCPCGGPLWWDAEPRLHRTEIVEAESSMWRYGPALPIGLAQRRITLGEVVTPLLAVEWGGREVWFKDETRHPTGSFKDRGVAMVVNHALAHRVGRLVEDSSGNAAAAFAAYCAAAGIGCEVHVPATTSTAKLAQVIAHGARVHQVAGPREAAALAAQSNSAGRYAGHNWHPLFVEGIATIGYELWEQAGYVVPDQVIVPVGNGSLVLGLLRSFTALLAGGEAHRLPRIIGVQSQASDAIHRRFHGLPGSPAAARTIAEGIAIRATTHEDEVVAALHQTNGDCYVVPDAEVVTALRGALAMGLFIEPTSAVALAGLTRLLAEQPADGAGRTVVVLTGSGLKVADAVAKLTTN